MLKFRWETEFRETEIGGYQRIEMLRNLEKY
ncbi:hypothetical protein Asulf_01387 [Archaeoglobus sulfaticallidus PM70-1]|uniref:Uncharacterized protein n=1 Tax=Archaeoglobus sulfaticallidus PM70-1 TaxID=387631 RepID=N0BED7_9EURY|nr:hypothetical protein Asulf_01387 [Archaeoglobus sulfaticallidus PM70-1]